MRFVPLRGGFAPALVVLWVACGDNTEHAIPFDATSGTRLSAERYLFDDGTTQPSPDGFFDTNLHVRCTPQVWSDGVTRCVPDAEDALFSDAACTTAIGRGMLIKKPSYFVRRDVMAALSRPAALYRAGEPVAAPGQYYLRVDDTCAGPYFTPSDYVYYALTGEESPPVELSETEVGDGRLVLRVRTSSDGATVPLAFVDRQLAVDCEPSVRGDGAAVCEPVGAPAATYFADAACLQPAVAISADASPQPLVARVDQEGDCPSYRLLAGELTTPIYRLDRGGCVAVSRDPSSHYVALGAEAPLAAVERTTEDDHRRLQRVLVSAEGLYAYGHRLVDTAIDDECARAPVGDVQRCMPMNTLSALDLYAFGCVQPVRVTAVPVRSCHPPTFAVTVTDDVELHAIGDVTSETVYRPVSDGTCLPYVPPAGEQLRTLGPALPEDTFLAAQAYGVR